MRSSVIRGYCQIEGDESHARGRDKLLVGCDIRPNDLPCESRTFEEKYAKTRIGEQSVNNRTYMMVMKQFKAINQDSSASLKASDT